MNRTEIVEDFIEFFTEHNLNEVYGCIHGPAGGKQRYHSCTFCRARLLDGELRVYSDKFIQVRTNRDVVMTGRAFKGPTAIEDAKEYIKTL